MLTPEQQAHKAKIDAVGRELQDARTRMRLLVRDCPHSIKGQPPPLEHPWDHGKAECEVCGSTFGMDHYCWYEVDGETVRGEHIALNGIYGPGEPEHECLYCEEPWDRTW